MWTIYIAFQDYCYSIVYRENTEYRCVGLIVENEM